MFPTAYILAEKFCKKLAVMTDEFDIPKEMLFELEKITVPALMLCVPAEIPAPPPRFMIDIVLPAVEIDMPAPATSDDTSGASNDTVSPLAPVVCDRLSGDTPTITSREPLRPVLPAVLPPVDTPAEKPAPPAFTLAVSVPAFSPKLTPLEFEKTIVPVLFAVVPGTAKTFPPSPAPPAPADNDSVKPALLLAVEPLIFVRFRVGLPWL